MFQKHFTEDKIYTIVGHLFFMAYLIGCLFYYEERLLNNDAAYYTFHLINYEEVFVKHQRYISYFTQWFPILLIKMGVGLKGVLIAYSGIFGVWFYGLFLLVNKVFKSPKLGIFLALALCLTMRYKHYAGHTEITFAIMVASTLVAWLSCDKSKLNWYNSTINWLIRVAFILWLYIIHPIIIIPLGIVIAADFFYHKKWKDPGYYIFCGLLIASFVMRFLTVTKDSYESGKIEILSTAKQVFAAPEKYHVFHIVGNYFNKDYHIIFAVFVVCILTLLFRKRILSSLSLLTGTMGIAALVIVTYSYLISHILIMIDGYLGMLGMPIGFAIYLVMKEDVYKKFFPYVVAALVLYCTLKINNSSSFLTTRLDNYKTVFKMYPEERKLYAFIDLYDWEKFWYPYEIPVETLMMTCQDGKDACKTLFVDYDMKGPGAMIKGTDNLMFFEHRMKIDELNQRFFYLPVKNPYYEIKKVPWK